MHRPVFCALAAIFLIDAASAHHGFGTFDRTREIEITGTITGIDFINPHSWVYLDVVGEDGATEPWRCELRAATVLRRSGWSADLFVPGEQLTINGAPDRNDPHTCYLSTAIFADGTQADRYGQLHRDEPTAAPALAAERPTRLPNGQPNLSGDWATEQLVMSDPRGRAGDLVPLSRAEQFDADRVIPDEEWAGNRTEVAAADEEQNFRQYRTRQVELTEEGQRAADNYQMYTLDDPRMRCETTSILFDWVYDGAVNRISQTDETVVLQYGQFGFTRTVHLGLDEHPEQIEPSRGGHSIGRWEGDVLVVDTIGFEPGVLSPPVMHSDQLHVVERFSLDAEDLMLIREYVATDPVNWVGEYGGTDQIQPADVPYSPDACEWEHTFINYDEQQQNENDPALAEPRDEPARPWWKFWD